jgi:hypothetical protein
MSLGELLVFELVIRLGSVCTYRYEETNDTADQLPLVKTGKPAVRIMMMHMTSAAGVEYSV